MPGPFAIPDEVIQLLGSNYSTTKLPTDRLGVIIDDTSRTIEDELSAFCVPFNSWTDDPPTPYQIKRLCQHYAAVQAMLELGYQTQNEDLIRSKLIGDEIMAGIKARRGYTQPESVTDETLTFGTVAESWALNTDEAFVGHGTGVNPITSGDAPNIIDGSLRISANSTTDGTFTAANAALMRYGEDYTVGFSKKYGRNVFTSLNANIQEHISTPKVSYKWNYVLQVGAASGSVATVLFNG